MGENNLCMSSHMSQPMDLTNYGGQHPQIASLWFFKYCDSWVQQTVMASGPSGCSGTDNEL